MELIGKAALWFVESKYGIAILLVLALTGGMLFGHHVYAKHYFEKGVAEERGRQLAAQAHANVLQAAENARRDREAAEISRLADERASKATNETDTTTNKTKEVIRYVYRDRPQNKPVAPGACVHPVDQRVQERLRAAVDSANRP
jgi:hypothetical protein